MISARWFFFPEVLPVLFFSKNNSYRFNKLIEKSVWCFFSNTCTYVWIQNEFICALKCSVVMSIVCNVNCFCSDISNINIKL